MKVGIVGPGNIARKAYLPVYAQMQDRFDFVVCSRDACKGRDIAAQFGCAQAVCGVDALLEAGVDAAFVHVTTRAHFETAHRLLSSGVPVCMDKPASQSLEETRALLDIAARNNVVFMIGFNRRFAPMTDKLKALPDKNLIHISKNRIYSQREPRRLVYDEFIHPLDTAVYLLDEDIQSFDSTIRMDEDGHMLRAMVRMETASASALVTMNLQSGANTETYEVQTLHGTYVLENLSELTGLTKSGKTVDTFGDWTPTLEKRGFEPMIKTFLSKVAGQDVDTKQQNVLLTHELCERMLQD